MSAPLFSPPVDCSKPSRPQRSLYRPHRSLSATPVRARRFPWWVLVAAVLLPCLYLPTLATRFDFIDDGNLVYPLPQLSAAQHWGTLWAKIIGNSKHLGPFRPVLWAHWVAEAELFAGDAFLWRGARLLWSMLAAGMLLWLLRELGIRPVAAILATALAFWNPYRSEIWTSLTLSEGVGMPYALLALVCAVRAARSSRPWVWDLLGALGILAALGCKVTFAAIVPAQVLLRLFPAELSLREGGRRHGWRAGLLGLTLLFPLIHFVQFKLTWQPGHYRADSISAAQLLRMLGAILGASSLNFLWPGVVLTGVALWKTSAPRSRYRGAPDRKRAAGLIPGVRTAGLEPAAANLFASYRNAGLAGAALLVCGIGIYLPMSGVSGRYSMPAIWGLDLGFAVLLSALAGVGASVWKRAAWATLACGLAAVAVANLGKQDKFAARAALLWQALEHVEGEYPQGTCLGWVAGPNLNIEEGIHFSWHLALRGRRYLPLQLLDADGRPQQRSELPPIDRQPVLLLSGAPTVPGEHWKLRREFAAVYWGGLRRYHCYLFCQPDQPEAVN